jgi:hypothetical protein
MSDDWVKHYIEDRTNKQRRTDMAVSGALSVFQKIQNRIKQDIQTFHDSGLFPNLRAGLEVPKAGFTVTVSDSLSRATLLMQLNVVLISYGYMFEKEGRTTPDSGSLKVCSDLEGNLRVYKDGERLADESDVSEISEFLLRPLLNHIDALSRR